MPHIFMEHMVDPSQVITDKIGDISEIEIAPTELMVVIYEPPAEGKTKGGVIITTATSNEYKYSGKVGLVVKTGANVFVDDKVVQFHGFKAKVGDWIVFRPSDGWPISINKSPCRVISDYLVKVKVPHPDMAY